MKHSLVYAAMALTLLTSSCLGARADITLKADGSGSLDLEYRISGAAESLGKLDGNEGWPIVPVGKTDFERTVARIDGLRLRSFRSRDEGKDLVNRARLDFTGPEALCRFLDPGGRDAVFTEEGGKRRLSLTLNAGAEAGSAASPEILELFNRISQGYFLELRFSLPREGEPILLTGKGSPRQPPGYAEIQVRRRQVSFKAPTGALLSDTEGLILELHW